MAATVLIVDDDAGPRMALVLQGQAGGMDADAVSDGRAALAYLRSRPRPRVVLLDLAMPVMDGWQFLDARRGDPELAAIPVLILTGEPVQPAAAKALGADGLLLKPADPREVLAALAPYR